MSVKPATGGGDFRKPRWGQWVALAAALVLLFGYVSSYYQLSRRGMREAKAMNMRGFLYVPVKDALTTQDLTRHHRLAQFYAPVNWLDREVFGADGPTVCILFGLSK